MFTLAKEMATVMSPVLSFTADEVWEHLPTWSGSPLDKSNGKSEFVFEELFPEATKYSDTALEAKFDKLLHVRKAVNKALELSRAAKVIGHPLDAKVVIGLKVAMPELDEGLSRFLIVSEVEVVDLASVNGGIANEEGDVTVLVSPSAAEKCARCWTHDATVGKNADHADLCERCAGVIAGMN
jgi:isoleucyl-tRNA synthetase